MTAAGSPFLYLTTRGRRSGQPREIEIWFTERAGRWHLVAEHGTRAQWVQNIAVEPRVRWRIGERHWAGAARLVSAEREPGLWRAVQMASARKYGWGEGLVVAGPRSRSAN